jgi:RNA polymerase-binding protein DksA
MDKERLIHYREILLEEKAQLTEEMKRLTDEEHLSIKEATGELSSYDNHPADQGTNTLDREVDLGLKDNTLIMLTEVNDALERLESGRYGICEHCGEEIKENRLEVVPAARFCTRCQQIEEEINGGDLLS